jgi:valyl-tRNA synthetase
MEPKIDPKFLKPYNPLEVEDKIYEKWEKSGYFNPDTLPVEKGGRFDFQDKKGNRNIFSIVLPPPNVTGILHMGSALMLAIEDIMVRYARMQGKRTLWIPGTDHAAIATQSKVEKEIQKKEGLSRYDLGREELLKRIDLFAKESHDTIVTQMRKMGCSIDWSREAFTLDEKRNVAVNAVFERMYNDGLIYRGFRVVNWDPKGQTTISDDEIEYETRKTKLYTFKYSKDIPISISTTRPETKLGDTAIAVHPEDERYKKYIGKEFKTNFAGADITLRVIADHNVEKDFGTGALGVTPAHSSIDYDMSIKHGLLLIQVIDERAKMMAGFDEKNAPAPEFIIKGKKVDIAREAVVKWLKSQDLLEKEEDIEHNISLAQRTGGVVEPLPKLQWFVAVNKPFKIPHSNIPGIKSGGETTLKEIMVQAVKSGAIKIIPDRFENVYFNWINNLRDWCISRQIWYGHRVPVWYKDGEKEIKCSVKSLGTEWKQDEDTLDTWFSSGLWTYSTMGWPKDASKAVFGKAGIENDFANYHPTDVLETGFDILPFWVARMILMTGYAIGEVPFKNVYLHGLVRDGQGRKISKSLGNNIDPLELIKKYGADAVRMSLIVGVGPGNDSKVGEDKVRAYKLFANKLWNITRFVLTSVGDEKLDPKFENWSEKDRELIKEFKDLILDITKDMDNYRYYLVGEKLYQYAWHRFADIILEESKTIIKDGNEVDKKSRMQLLLYVLTNIIKALHPFMPYVTEEIWSSLPVDNKEMLIVNDWVK